MILAAKAHNEIIDNKRQLKYYSPLMHISGPGGIPNSEGFGVPNSEKIGQFSEWFRNFLLFVHELITFLIFVKFY